MAQPTLSIRTLASLRLHTHTVINPCAPCLPGTLNRSACPSARAAEERAVVISAGGHLSAQGPDLRPARDTTGLVSNQNTHSSSSDSGR